MASEVSSVQGATGVRIGSLLQNFASLGVGIIISFIYSWQLTLLILIFVPFIVAGGFLQKFLVTGFATKDSQALEHASKVISTNTLMQTQTDFPITFRSQWNQYKIFGQLHN